jgi:hypothetical protein
VLRARTSWLIFIFILGGGISLFSHGLSATEQSAAYQKQSEGVVLKTARFELKSSQDGLTAENYKFLSETWQSSDGVTIFLTRVYCPSSRQAVAVLRQSSRKATRIFEKSFVRDTDRRILGQRIVVSFGSESMTHPRVVLWTSRSVFYTLESSSYQHSLLFEKKLPKVFGKT